MKKTKVGQDLIKGLTEAIAYARGEITLRSTDVEFPSEPPLYTKEEIRRVREEMHFSQPVMGRYLGVTGQTVQSWELGSKKPTGSARRLIQILSKHPEVFRDEQDKTSKKRAR